ncbi:hypothetical protein DICA3_F15412 [Diutina catenulata]
MTSPIAIEHRFDDHPEPELVASSYKDSDGHLIPSTSSISLLSLNDLGPQIRISSPQQLPRDFKEPKDRKNSFASQQRINHYRILNSPPFSAAMSPLDHVVSPVSAPDSPTLDPTSIGGSPSRLLLTSTISESLSNAMGSPPPLSPHVDAVVGFMPSLSMTPAKKKFMRSNAKILSPVLHPVQTPVEEPPMTPLYLSSRSSYFDDGLEPVNESFNMP